MPPMIEIPLDLPEVRVLKTELKKDGIYITVESTRDYATCSRCGKVTREFHSYGNMIRLRHVPILEQKVFIELRPKRYRCPDCENNPTTTQQCDWYDGLSRHTKGFEKSLLRQLINGTVQDVERKMDIGYDAVEGTLDRWIKSSVAWSEFTELKTIGIDEIALRKGHKNFVVIVTRQGQDSGIDLLGVLPDRKKETVIEFLKTIPAELAATVENVCSDMYDGFTNAVKEVIPQANIMIDRFHVAKAYRECVDKLRKTEQAELNQELKPEEYKSLKGAMWALRQNAKDLKPEQQSVVDHMLNLSEDLATAYDLREELSDIFDTDLGKQEAVRQISNWMKKVKNSGLICFDSFLITLENRLDEITNYFINRQTSGFVEGINNKIKVLKRRCYGITNIHRLFQRIWLDLKGFDLFGPISANV